MNSILLILLGVVLGVVIGWLLAGARTRTEMVKSQVDAEGRVKAAEGTLQEVRARLGSPSSHAGWPRAANWAGFSKNSETKASRRSRRKPSSKTPGMRPQDSNQLRERLKVEGELRVAAETKLRETQANLEEQKQTVGRSEERL